MAISRVDAVSTTKIPTANAPAMMGRRGGLESVGGNARSSISLAPTPLVVPPCLDRGDHRVAVRPSFIISAQHRAHETGSKGAPATRDVAPFLRIGPSQYPSQRRDAPRVRYGRYRN